MRRANVNTHDCERYSNDFEKKVLLPFKLRTNWLYTEAGPLACRGKHVRSPWCGATTLSS